LPGLSRPFFARLRRSRSAVHGHAIPGVARWALASRTDLAFARRRFSAIASRTAQFPRRHDVDVHRFGRFRSDDDVQLVGIVRVRHRFAHADRRLRGPTARSASRRLSLVT